jgi:hypothetical protein
MEKHGGCWSVVARVTRWVATKIAQIVANLIFFVKKMHNFYSGKGAPKFGLLLHTNFEKNLPKANNGPMRKFAESGHPSLVALGAQNTNWNLLGRFAACRKQESMLWSKLSADFHQWPGTDVRIYKIFSPKNSAKKVGVFDSKQS